jgi:hypothetical protein
LLDTRLDNSEVSGSQLLPKLLWVLILCIERTLSKDGTDGVLLTVPKLLSSKLHLLRQKNGLYFSFLWFKLIERLEWADISFTACRADRNIEVTPKPDLAEVRSLYHKRFMSKTEINGYIRSYATLS